MIYETKVQYTTVDDKVVKESLIVEEAVCFAEAELITSEFCQGRGINDFDVTEIKRSKLKEIINKRTNGDEFLFVADVADIQLTDEGDELEIIYKMALFAENLDKAYEFVKQYLAQGYNMIIVGIKKTRFADVICK